MKNCVIAIDLGATSGRMILSYIDNGQLEMQEIARFDNRIENREGRFHWNLKSLFSEIIKGLNYALSLDYKILSIGVDTWGVDMGFIDEKGNVIEDPRAYRDPYTNGIMQEYFSIIPKETVYKKTGIQFMNFNSLFQLYAANKEKYAPLKQADKILFMPDLISYMLTGNAVCEYTIASTSQFMDPNMKKVDADLLKAAGIDASKFPDIVMPGPGIENLRQAIFVKPRT